MTEHSDVSRRTISGFDLLLPPEQFVERCAALFNDGGGTSALSSEDRHALADAIRAGVPKLAVLETFLARTEEGGERRSSRYDDLPQDWGRFVSVELLIRFAPDDDDTFLRQAFSQLKGRAPTEKEALVARHQLETLAVDRFTFIEGLATDGQVGALASQRSTIGATDWDFVEREGRRTAVLLRLTNEGLGIARGMTLQRSPTEHGRLRCAPGLVLSGPKRNLATGKWDVHICLSQDARGELLFDVVANGGVATLARAHLIGPTYSTLRVHVEPWHHFLEVRLYKPTQASELSWVKIHQIAVHEAV